jgi:NADH-ubiquinone oxidoreductase chain 4
VAFGSVSPYLATAINRDVTRREWLVRLPLIILTLLLGIMPNIIYDVIHTSVMTLLVR